MVGQTNNSAFYKYRLGELLNQGDRDGATAVLQEWGAVNGYQSSICDILEPVLNDFDKEWSQPEDISLGQAYILGKVSEDILNLVENSPSTGPSDTHKGPIIIGNIEDDFHALGRKLVSTFSSLAGWKMIDLGNDISASEFVDTAEENHAPIIGVSAMILRNAMNIQKVREELDKRNLSNKIKLAVGGAVFCQRPELVNEVGGNGTSVNAIHAPALFEKLINEINAKELTK